jgi:hypothetical protein
MKKKLPFPLLLFSLFAFQVQAQSWLAINDFPATERDDGTCFSIGDKVYCGTGLTPWFSASADFHSFNLNNDSWSNCAPLPSGMERQYACGFSNNQFGYVFGGINGNNALNDLWQYNPVTNTWISKNPMPTQGRMGACAFVINDTAYILGGKSNLQTVLDEFWAYCFSADSWTFKGALPFGGRWRASAIATQNKGYLMFGQDTNLTPRKELFEFDQNNQSWSTLSYFPLPGRSYASMQILDGDLIVFAGLDSLQNSHQDLWSFDLDALQWDALNALPAAPRRGGMSFCTNNTFYYTCGINQNNVRLKETWKIDFPTALNPALAANEIIIYPNPCKDFLLLETGRKSELLQVEICDIHGKTMLRQGIKEKEIISMASLPKGIYLLKIYSANFWSSTRIVKSE